MVGLQRNIFYLRRETYNHMKTENIHVGIQSIEMKTMCKTMKRQLGTLTTILVNDLYSRVKLAKGVSLFIHEL